MSLLVGSISFYLFTFNNKLFVFAFSSRWCFAVHSFRTFPKKLKVMKIILVVRNHNVVHKLLMWWWCNLVVRWLIMEWRRKVFHQQKKSCSSNITKEIEKTRTNAATKSTTSTAIQKYEWRWRLNKASCFCFFCYVEIVFFSSCICEYYEWHYLFISWISACIYFT